jgi:cytochrome c5
MKYMCMGCRAIHEYLASACQCCAPRVEPIADEQVAPCETGGEDCMDEFCAFCHGTGWMLRPSEIAKDTKRA